MSKDLSLMEHSAVANKSKGGKRSMMWIIFVVGAVLAWGVYGPALHKGQVVLGNPPHPSRTEKRQEYLNSLTHLGRVGRFEEFGKAIAFLASDDASYISGASLAIDGGIQAMRLTE